MELPPQLFRALESFKDQVKDALWTLSSCMCQRTPKIKINGRTFQIVKILGEGGFSFVFLAQDEHSGRQFALKKIRCPTGSEGVKEAMREVEAYRRFKHPNIIRILDSAVVQDPEGEGQIVYLFLPLYKRGNLQDAINVNAVNNQHFPEQEMVRLFKGTCEAVRAMHEYQPTTPQYSVPGGPSINSSSPLKTQQTLQIDQHSDNDELFPRAEGGVDGEGYAYDSVNVPLVTKHQDEEDGRNFEDEQLSASTNDKRSAVGETFPYAHRDIKPGNIMVSDRGHPILMDFGSTMKARVHIENRQQALLQQDIAAEQSTMAYRAPELLDVKTDVTIDEKVDIWSLGCTLFAIAYSHSPFENIQITEQGGSIAMAVLNAQYKHPESTYSQGLKDLIDSMLKVNPKDRPDINQVLQLTDRVLQTLA